MASETKIKELIALLRGEKVETGLCPVYEFKDGIFTVSEDGELSGIMVKIGETNFIPGFALISLPLSEKDKQEIEEIKNGKETESC